MSAGRALAIIPARGGSKRIPRKNVRPFAGKPMLQHSVEAARASGCFAEIMVSTDDEEIAAVARTAGATVPFARSAAASDDHAPLATVVIEVLRSYAERERAFDEVCLLLATAPLVTAARLREGEALLRSSHADAVVPVVAFSFPILRALRLKDGRLSFMWPEHELTRSQDLEPAYHDAGQFYWLRTASFLAQRRLFAAHTVAMPLSPVEVQDIDTDDDWALAELKHAVLHRRA